MEPSLPRCLTKSLLLFAFTFSVAAKAIPGDEVCAKDVERLCRNVSRGEGRIGRCLSEKHYAVSRECSDFWYAFRAQRTQTKNNCYGFVREHCLSVPPGKGRVVQCLRKHLKGFDNSCTQDLEKIPSFAQ